MTVGVGKYRQGTLTELLDALNEAIHEYEVPHDASCVRAPVGSVHALELIWVAES